MSRLTHNNFNRITVLFALGFRPFFLFAGAFALLAIAIWVPIFINALSLPTYYGELGWHSHEMIFGYSAAVVAGFLLTAVRNWTDSPTPAGGSLAAITILWLLGRILPLFPSVLPGWLIALVDLGFFPVLVVAIGIPLVRSGGTRNLIFPPLLGAFVGANLLVHLEVLGLAENVARRGIFLGLNLLILLIVIMGGRVIPFFTERALQGASPKRHRAIEQLASISVLTFIVAELILPDSPVSGIVAALAATANGIRLLGWYTNRFWAVPLLWVLHLGYGWIVAGFILKALAAFGFISPQFTIHAFTVGAIGVLTLGMMARVSLGHTGRPLKAASATALAFVLINLAALLRGLLPVFFPQMFLNLVAFSGALWISAFLIFMVVYVPILTAPRINGRSG
jgi:uncharacterized protein involved in response to NO